MPATQADFEAIRRGAVIALAGMAIRQLLDDARDSGDDVLSVRINAQASGGVYVAEFELIDSHGRAIGGGGL